MTQVLGVLRVRNEARWIADSLRSIRPLCDKILVMDDHSQDDTSALARAEGAVVLPSPFDNLNEARDKNWLLGGAIAEAAPAWVFWIDGDEALHEGDHAVLRADMNGGRYQYFALRVVYLWDRPDQARADGVYGRFWRPSLFRFRPGLKFKALGPDGDDGPGLHCSNVPDGLPGGRQSRARLLHYGYMEQRDRIRKYNWYNSLPVPAVEDGYRHIVVGDLFPADAQFRHGGPLRLESLCEAAC